MSEVCTWIELYARAQDAHTNCIQARNRDWEKLWAHVIKQLHDLLPYGSGIDGKLSVNSYSPKRLEIQTEYHIMDENGFYNGWTMCTLIVEATFRGIEITSDARDVESDEAHHIDYIEETIYDVLTAKVTLDQDFNVKFDKQ